MRTQAPPVRVYLSFFNACLANKQRNKVSGRRLVLSRTGTAYRFAGLITQWRRTGDALGFTTGLFFLCLRQLLSVSSSQESNRVFYTGTLGNIVSRWRESRASLKMQNILLNIVCDLVVQGRGVFSDCPYLEYITAVLLETAGDILCVHKGSADSHIIEALLEIETVEPENCLDMGFRRDAVETIS
jgi:hypothetical protein